MDSDAPESPAAPKPSRRWWRFLAEVAVALLLVAGVQAWRGRDLLPSGSPAPDLVLRDLDGRLHHLSDFRGHPVMLHFWATWCGVCRQEFGALASVDAERGNGLLIAAADDSDDLAALRTFAAERRLTYPIFRVEGGSAAPWGVKVFPTSFYLDREGRIVTHQMGMTTRWSMRFWLWWAGRG